MSHGGDVLSSEVLKWCAGINTLRGHDTQLHGEFNECSDCLKALGDLEKVATRLVSVLLASTPIYDLKPGNLEEAKRKIVTELQSCLREQEDLVRKGRSDKESLAYLRASIDGVIRKIVVGGIDG